ncbi:pyrroline-5-carboxylate reductase [Kribbia dieselivorans]|uniref:pyrroline-5-carboxylate reductase n=1 Tax=Kribbia dieselivorans TaxID=331526 RepID=UPI0008386EBE|nr:pyrroline-5-carboxylate reductase [Kribbia dieselivorans]
MGTLSIFGVGAMGEAILGGLIAGGQDPAQVSVVDASADRVAQIAGKYGVRAVGVAEAAGAETIFVVVKPYTVGAVLDEISPHLAAGGLVVSFAAGVDLATMTAHTPAGTALIRVMPNTPALIGEAMCALSPGEHASEAHVARVTELLSGLGKVVTVPESQQPAVTAVSGSGPAYVFHLAEAMIEAGVHLGLPRATAHTLAVQTLLGSAKLLDQSGEHPSLLREQVTSPGGTTAAALRVLDDRAVRGSYLAALEAAAQRALEL